MNAWKSYPKNQEQTTIPTFRQSGKAGTGASPKMTATFAEQPVPNSPYDCPARHWELGSDGIPTGVIAGRRREAKHVAPVPPPRRSNQQRTMQLGTTIPTDEGQEYDPSPVINEICRHVDARRQISSPGSWGVTPETARLLQHWRSHDFSGYRPFFCQVESAETVIWLTEVAGLMSAGASRRREYEVIRRHIAGAKMGRRPYKQ